MENNHVPFPERKRLTFWVNSGCHDSLTVIGGSLVIQDGIEQDPDAARVGLMDETSQLLLGAPFCVRRALLLELAQIVQIVDVVTVAGMPARLAGGRDPQAGDAEGLQAGQGSLETTPVRVVGRDIPLEALEHGLVLQDASATEPCPGPRGHGRGRGRGHPDVQAGLARI